MPGIKLLLADVDGTLVTKEKILTDRAKKAVEGLRAKDIKFAITSGRPPRGMKMLIEPLAIDTVVAGFNGGLYAKPDLSTVESHTLPTEVAKRTAKIILDLGLDLWIYRGEDWLVRDLKAPHVDREEWTVKFPPKQVANFDDSMDGVVKLVGISDDLKLVEKAEKAAQDALGKEASAARSQPYYLDVTHPSANKGDVVGYLAKTYGIKPEEIATIGDMPNDTLMFAKSGLAIAMGQSSDEVKKKAQEVTSSSEEEGFASAVERLLLK